MATYVSQSAYLRAVVVQLRSILRTSVVSLQGPVAKYKRLPGGAPSLFSDYTCKLLAAVAQIAMRGAPNRFPSGALLCGAHAVAEARTHVSERALICQFERQRSGWA